MQSPLRICMINMIADLRIGNINIQELPKLLKIPKNTELGVIGFQTDTLQVGTIPPEAQGKKQFNNQFTLFVKISKYKDVNKIFKVKLYKTGTIHVPGCKEEEDCVIVMKIIAEYLSEFIGISATSPEIIKEKSMYSVQYNLSSKNINRAKVAKIFDEYGYFANFEPNKYSGVIIKIPVTESSNKKKNVTVIVQNSGIISIKGANNEAMYMKIYEICNEIFNKHAKEIVIENKGTPQLANILRSIRVKSEEKS